MKVSPEIERIYNQLIWIERRRFRIISSVSAHFGKSHTEEVLAGEKIGPSLLEGEPAFQELIDERPSQVFLRDLAATQEMLEAATVTAIRSHVSVYREHVDEQILFGARTAGQEAGRSFLAGSRPVAERRPTLDVQEAIQAVFELTYNGLPGEKNHFLCLRSWGGSTVHFSRSPHLQSWKTAGGDPRFLYAVKTEWIKGILDILSPNTEFSSSRSIEQGSPFGLAHFFLRGQHADP